MAPALHSDTEVQHSLGAILYNVEDAIYLSTAHERETTCGVGTKNNRGGQFLTRSLGPGGPIITGTVFFPRDRQSLSVQTLLCYVTHLSSIPQP